MGRYVVSEDELTKKAVAEIKEMFGELRHYEDWTETQWNIVIMGMRQALRYGTYHRS